MTEAKPGTAILEQIEQITEADLAWWLNTIPSLDWVFAVTYAEGAPHEYICDRTEGLTQADFVRAARVIRTFGEPQKFYKWTRTYLVHNGWKYWDMEGNDLSTCNLINRGRAHHIYGAQNAPLTRSTHVTEYDGLATYWDAHHGLSAEEREGTVALVAELGDFTKRRVLDIGCGTGLALDLAITVPVRYTGIDPSGPMLNELVRKYPLVAGVHPMSFADVLRTHVLGGTKFDLIVALGGSASYLSQDDLASLPLDGSTRYCLTAFAKGESPITGDLDETDLETARVRLHSFALERAGRIERVGRFDFLVPVS